MPESNEGTHSAANFHVRGCRQQVQHFPENENAGHDEFVTIEFSDDTESGRICSVDVAQWIGYGTLTMKANLQNPSPRVFLSVDDARALAARILEALPPEEV